ncbi:MAG TPA: DinB family protein [Gemmatimonadaceae bacterium]|nr:DinB family protein [Gemmatimonadaceae bacterium]
MTTPEAWLRGPMEGIEPVLQPAAFALQQAREDIAAAVAGLSEQQLRDRPGGVASLEFHLRHIPGSIDRLLAYSRGQPLTDAQRAAQVAESTPLESNVTSESLFAGVNAAIDRAVLALRSADPATLHEPRGVGRAQLPSTVFGVLFHIAEHTQRHTGQIIVTAKVVRASVSR